MPRHRHRGWSLDQESRSAFSNVMSTPTYAAKKRSARADGAAALSSVATPESKRVGNGVDVASALFKTLGSAASETYATHNHWASPGIQLLYNVAHYTRLSPSRGAGDLGMDDTSEEALDVMRSATHDYVEHVSSYIDELCAVLTQAHAARNGAGGGRGARTQIGAAAADEAAGKKVQRLERALAASEAARRAADAELIALRRGAGPRADPPPAPMQRCFSDAGLL